LEEKNSELRDLIEEKLSTNDGNISEETIARSRNEGKNSRNQEFSTAL
jgi:hypothetical protein